MAVTASMLRVFPTLAVWRMPQGGELGLGRARVPVFRRNCVRFWSLRCSAEESVGDSTVRGGEKDAAAHVESTSLDSDGVDVPLVEDKFGGWYGADEVDQEKNTLKIAAMQVASGFLLALGLSLSYYVWCQKHGRRVIPPLPTLTQIQLPSSLKKTLQTQLPSFFNRSSEGTEHSDHDDIEVNEESNSRNSFGKHVEESFRSDEDKGVKSDDVEHIEQKEQQVLEKDEQYGSDDIDEHQNTTLVPSGWQEASLLPQEQGFITFSTTDDSSRDSPDFLAKPSNIQIDSDNIVSDGNGDLRPSASDPTANSSATERVEDNSTGRSYDKARPPSSESVLELRNSGRDSNKSLENGSDESQLEPSKPRKLRRSQGFKRKMTGKVIVPAVVDRIQEQALAVLQALKVVEEGVDPRAICNRRDYARWIISSSNILSRSPANKILPAMYIESVTKQAFADIASDDPDFPYIQGLAEAGLIPSNLSVNNGDRGSYDSDSEMMYFSPDSPVTRQDLVSWKVALGRRSLPTVDKETFKAKSGFLDIDRIDNMLWPLLSDDLNSGGNSIIVSAFGFTRIFQPEKPATVGQAAIALGCGDTSEKFGEELARVQVEWAAHEAAVADDAMKAQKQKELDELFDGQLSAERQQKELAQQRFEELKAEFERMKFERDAEKDVILKDKAAVKSEKELLHYLKEQVDEQLQALTMREMQVSIEQKRLENLRSTSEVHEEELSKMTFEIEVERNALIQARFWAEDEARGARAHAEALEKTLKRKASREQVEVADRSWHYNAKNELKSAYQRAPIQGVVDKVENLFSNVRTAFIQSLKTILRVINGFLERVKELLQEIRWKIRYFYSVTSSSAGNLLQDSAHAVNQRLHGVQSTVLDFSSKVADGTKRLANDCRDGAQKLSRRFKAE